MRRGEYAVLLPYSRFLGLGKRCDGDPPVRQAAYAGMLPGRFTSRSWSEQSDAASKDVALASFFDGVAPRRERMVARAGTMAHLASCCLTHPDDSPCPVETLMSLLSPWIVTALTTSQQLAVAGTVRQRAKRHPKLSIAGLVAWIWAADKSLKP